jgi:hypothetical protein
MYPDFISKEICTRGNVSVAGCPEMRIGRKMNKKTILGLEFFI